MKYQEFKNVVAGDEAFASVHVTLIRAGLKEVTGLCMSDEEAEEWCESVYITDKNKFCSWEELKNEISENVRIYSNDPVQLKRYICSLLTPLEEMAEYFDYNPNLSPKENIVPIILAKAGSMWLASPLIYKEWEHKADTLAEEECDRIRHQRFLECDDEDAEEWDDRFEVTTDEYEALYDKYFEIEKKKHEEEWNKTEYTILYKIRFGLKQLAYIIQGALLENNVKENIFYFEKLCGVILTRKVDVIDLVNAMNWTWALSESYQSETICYENTHSRNEILKMDLGYHFPPEVLTEDRRFAKSMAAFVRYCEKNGMFYPFTKEAWRPIHNKVFDGKGNPVTADQLAQSYQDQISKGSIVPTHK